MVKTEEQELIDQIARLDSELKTYKKAIANPPSWVDTKILADTIFQLEAEIRELNAQLEVHQLISMIFDFVTQPVSKDSMGSSLGFKQGLVKVQREKWS